MLPRGFTPWDRVAHIPIDTEVARHLRARLRCPDIGTLWNARSQNWVAVVWLTYNGRRGFWALTVLGKKDPERKRGPELTRGKADWLERLWNQPEDPRQIARELRSEDRSQDNAHEDEAREITSERQYIGRRVNPVFRDRSPTLASAARKKRIYG